MVIRPAVEQDISALTAIYNDAVLNTTATFDLEPVTEASRREWFHKHGGKYPVLVAVNQTNGAIMGWGSLSPFGEKAAYRFACEHSIYVAPNYHRRGVGSAILQELIRLAGENGFHCLIARITAENGVSLALHTRFGFAETGVLREVGYKFNRWLDVVLMQKTV